MSDIYENWSKAALSKNSMAISQPARRQFQPLGGNNESVGLFAGRLHLVFLESLRNALLGSEVRRLCDASGESINE